MLSVAAFHTTAGESNPYNTLTNLAFYIQNSKPWSQPDWFLSAVKNSCQICPTSLLRVQYVWCLSFSAFLPKPSNRLAILFFFFFFLFFFFGCTPGSSQARGLIRAAAPAHATTLATPDPYPIEQGQGSNPHLHGCWLGSLPLSHDRDSRAGNSSSTSLALCSF